MSESPFRGIHSFGTEIPKPLKGVLIFRTREDFSLPKAEGLWVSPKQPKKGDALWLTPITKGFALCSKGDGLRPESIMKGEALH